MKPASIKGIVTKYKGNGRKLGYPTANINTITDLSDGVYFGYSDLAKYKNHPSLIFIGTPTTVGDRDRRVEAYLLDIPDKDYYGQDLAIEVVKFYRNNITFNNLKELIDAMNKDQLAARDWFKSINNDNDRS